MNFFKKLILLLIILLALLFLGVGLLVALVNPNQFKPFITQEVLKRSGYQLTIDGNLSWSFSPPISVAATHMTLREAKQTKIMAEMKDVKIGMQLWPFWEIGKHFEGELKIGALTFVQMQLNNFSTNIYWRNNNFSLKPVTANLYQGRMQGEVNLRQPLTAPAWGWQLAIHGVQIAPLLADLNGGKSKLQVSGMGNITFDGNTAGKTRNELLSKMNGEGSYRLSNGVLHGVDVNYLLGLADAFLSKKPKPIAPSQRQTAFGDLSGSYAIRNGVATTNDLLLDAADVTVHGQGTVNLLSQAVNFHLQLTSKHTRKLVIPVLISGTLSNPIVQLDQAELTKAIAGSQIEKVKQKVRKQIQEHVPGKAGEFLQNLLGH